MQYSAALYGSSCESLVFFILFIGNSDTVNKETMEILFQTTEANYSFRTQFHTELTQRKSELREK